MESIPTANKYFYVPLEVTPVYTGHDEALRFLRKGCLPQNSVGAGSQQRRVVLYGLGGSGKSQTCFKFAHDHRER